MKEEACQSCPKNVPEKLKNVSTLHKMIHIEGEGPRSTTARVCFFTQIESDCMWGGRGILTKPLCMEESRNWMELRTTGLAALVEEKKKTDRSFKSESTNPWTNPWTLWCLGRYYR